MTTEARTQAVVPVGSDNVDVVRDIKRLADNLDTVVAIDGQGTSFPTNPVRGAFWVLTTATTGVAAPSLWRHDGTTWRNIPMSNTTDLHVGPGVRNPGRLSVTTTDPGEAGLIVKGSPSQAADLAQFRRPDGVPLVNVTADGRLKSQNLDSYDTMPVLTAGSPYQNVPINVYYWTVTLLPGRVCLVTGLFYVAGTVGGGQAAFFSAGVPARASVATGQTLGEITVSNGGAGLRYTVVDRGDVHVIGDLSGVVIPSLQINAGFHWSVRLQYRYL